MARKAAEFREDAETVATLPKKRRTYNSPRRQEQAAVTKKRIVEAALQLVKEKGYADMTLEAIAQEAGVAPQTVYAVCGSKKGVLAAILEHTVEAKQYDKLRDTIPTIMDGRTRIREVGRFYAALQEDALPVFDIMRGMSVLSPEFAEQEQDQGLMLFEKTRRSVQMMEEAGMLRPGLSVERAAELHWAIVTPGMHRRLTKVLGWSAEEYAAWVSYLLEVVLMGNDAQLPFLNEKPLHRSHGAGIGSISRKDIVEAEREAFAKLNEKPKRRRVSAKDKEADTSSPAKEVKVRVRRAAAKVED